MICGVELGMYYVMICEYGDFKDGVGFIGLVWVIFRGDLGIVEVGEDGWGLVFMDYGFEIWEMIGYVMVLMKQGEEFGKIFQNDENIVVGVIVRSVGMWDNDKMVCLCIGKILWEECKDEVWKGMLQKLLVVNLIRWILNIQGNCFIVNYDSVNG